MRSCSWWEKERNEKIALTSITEWHGYFIKKMNLLYVIKSFVLFFFKRIGENLVIVGSIILWIYCEYIHIQFWDKLQQILFFLFLSRKAFSFMKWIKYFSNVWDQVHSHILLLRSENKTSMDVNHFYNFNIKICLNA